MVNALALHSERPLRLLFVVDSLQMGGAEQHAVHLAGALASQGHEVTLACSVEGSLAAQARKTGVSVSPLCHHLAKRRWSFAFARGLRHLMRHTAFDLVHTHMYASNTAAMSALLGTTTPLVITEHSEARWRSWRARWISHWAYQRAAHIIAVSRSIEHRLQEVDHVPAARLSVLPNGVPPYLFDPQDMALPLSQELSAGPIVGVVARLQPEKGVQHFVQAAALVHRQQPAAQFLIVGDGPLRAELEAQVARRSLSEQVHFLGFRQDARRLMGSLDLLVIPSLSEGTPLVTLEAMAAGVPVLATRVGGIPEQICHGRTGWLVEPANPAALADAMLYLLSHPRERQELGQAGCQAVTQHFSFERMVQETLTIYRTVLGTEASVSEEPPLMTPLLT